MGKTADGLKALGPKSVVAGLTAILAVTSPNFARTTSYVVSLPDIVYPLPVLLAALAALYAMFANRLPRCRWTLVAVLSVACVLFEVGCAWAQWACADWNYLSVNMGFNLIGRVLRLAAFCALMVCASCGEGLSGGVQRRAVVYLAVAGVLGSLALWCLSELECPRGATLAFSIIGWACLAGLSGLAAARGAAACVPFSNGAFAFLVGALVGDDVATILGGVLVPGADAAWALPAFFVLAAASFIPLVLPWPLAVSEDGADAPAEGRVSEVLAAVPGAEGLSEREAQVMAAELAGASDADIADELGLKPQTVATYRTRAYQKLGVSCHAGFVDVVRSCSGLGPRTAAGRPLPLAWRSIVFRAALGTAALLLLAVLLRVAVPVSVQRVVLLCGSLALFVRGSAGFARVQTDHAGFEPQIVVGCICACVGAVVSPQLPTLFGWRALAAPVTAFLCLVWVVCAARDETIRSLTVMTCGVVGLLTVQAGSYGLQAPSPWPQLALPLVGLLAVAMLGIDRRLAEKELSDAVLVGEARCTSYLRGRGLSELEASVLILSAKRLSRTAIAESLSVSIATVSTYKTRAIKKLRVADIDEAVCLMREEGGLN